MRARDRGPGARNRRLGSVCVCVCVCVWWWRLWRRATVRAGPCTPLRARAHTRCRAPRRAVALRAPIRTGPDRPGRFGPAGQNRFGRAGQNRFGRAGQNRLGRAGQNRVGPAGQNRTDGAGRRRRTRALRLRSGRLFRSRVFRRRVFGGVSDTGSGISRLIAPYCTLRQDTLRYVPLLWTCCIGVHPLKRLSQNAQVAFLAPLFLGSVWFVTSKYFQT